MTKSKAKAKKEVPAKLSKEQKAELKAREKAAKKKAAELAKKKADAAKKREAGASEDMYLVTLTVNSTDVFTAESENLAEAILELKPNVQVKTKALITVEFNGLKTERTVFPKHLKRPLVNKDAAVFLAKQLSLCLK